MSNPHRQHFNDYVPEPQISRAWLAVYFAGILACYAIVSSMDYRDTRREECERKSYGKYVFTYQPSTDTCVKEYKSGTTKKN